MATPAAVTGRALRDVTLDDKYELRSGRVFMTGIQALVRLGLEQRRRDEQVGLNTAGYITGYRGSPLGGLDQQLWRATSHLDRHAIKFNPAINEDLAATACWGTQQVGLEGETDYDGVFAIWYGKGPGVDRSGDALRHGNLAGSAPGGGVLCLLGDDHICESSTTAHQSELAMVDLMIPVLNPAGVQEILDCGLLGIAMSRFSGCWVALKCVHDTVESAATVNVDDDRLSITQPADHPVPDGGLHIRWPDAPVDQERRLHEHKLDAAIAFARANRIDTSVFAPIDARIGIVTTGKSYLDVRQALENLGIDAEAAEQLGLRLRKVVMTYPIEPRGMLEFCQGLDLVMVIEEKRALMETQLKELLYARDGAPRVIGKRDEDGEPLFRSAGLLDTNHIAFEIGRRLQRHGVDPEHAPRIDERVAAMQARLSAPRANLAPLTRIPYFCPGCPHNSSTKVPEGSKALAGIGCHYLAQFMDRRTARYTHMGAEGASWIGQGPFSTREHVFQNIGDGTYMHSGLLAIRAAIASGVNMTYKILYNDAVAMTGGQAVDGTLSVPRITQQMKAEGATRIAVVTDEPDKYPAEAGFAEDVEIYPREELDAVQRSFREVSGVSVIVYDQTCAAEKRRRRKRGTFPDPDRRAFINDEVCEGCGDCGIQSNCLAVTPLDTPLGRKRAIDQSACNKDFSCINGFCPSFVTVHGARIRKAVEASAGPVIGPWSDLPAPELPQLDEPMSILITGVGGTGVVTIGALLGMAAHLEGKGASILDQLGLAQKGGAVVSHFRIAAGQDEITSTRIADGAADLVLGCDLLVTGASEQLAAMAHGRTRVLVNTHQSMVGDFTRNPDLEFPGEEMSLRIAAAVGEGRVYPVPANVLATRILGDAIGSNIMMLGFAYQRGLIPLSETALLRAIEINGVAVDMNKRAFALGRQAAHDLDRLQSEAKVGATVSVLPPRAPSSLAGLVEDRASRLAAYQSEAYANRFRALVGKVEAAEKAMAGPASRRSGALAGAVAQSYARLLAYKDEYEVARLYADPAFLAKLKAQFDGELSLEFHLAPPLLARTDPGTGRPRKMSFGPWMMAVFRVLARFKRLRGTWFDPFGWSAERRMERRLIREFEAMVHRLVAELDDDNGELAVALVESYGQIRGFGPVKAESIATFEARQAELLKQWPHPEAAREAA